MNAIVTAMAFKNLTGINIIENQEPSSLNKMIENKGEVIFKPVDKVMFEIGSTWDSLAEENKKRASEILDDVVEACTNGLTKCNVCGSNLDRCEGLELNFIPGYGSSYDLMQTSMHMCWSCTDDLIEKCKIDPVIGEVI